MWRRMIGVAVGEISKESLTNIAGKRGVGIALLHDPVDEHRLLQ